MTNSTSSTNEAHAQPSVPFFRPSISAAEIDEVVACLRSGWLTTGPRTARFEHDFAASVGGKHAVAVNSCTAALHLAVEALNLGPGQAVLVPTMTFAATAEIVRYQGAVPILVDCDPVTLNMDLEDAARKLGALQSGELPVAGELAPVGIIPVHVGGRMMDMQAVRSFAQAHDLWVVEDAAHAYPAAYEQADGSVVRCGENTSDVTCFSFYANKTITTGEGGMAVTHDASLAARMRQMSLHGLSTDAWKRYSGNPVWDYKILAPGYKYNLTDVASSIGIHQVAKAHQMRDRRQQLAERYLSALSGLPQIDLPVREIGGMHAWHLFAIRLNPARLSIDRNALIDQLRSSGVGCSVHWRPLHLHPYYANDLGWRPEHCPTASAIWPTLISLPLFSDMAEAEQDHVIQVITQVVTRHSTARPFSRAA